MFKTADALGALVQSFSGGLLFSYSGFNRSQFVLHLQVIPDGRMKIRSDLCAEHKHLTGLLQLMAK